MNIAIVGGGIAGSALAHFLSKSGKHSITVFEKQDQPKPVGAGIMLQPPGKKVLERLGVGDFLKQNGHPISKFKGKLESGETVVSLDFEEVTQNVQPLGVHRGFLFKTLVESLRSLDGVDLQTGYEAISGLNLNTSKVEVCFSNGEKRDDFDFVVVANGSRTLLRDHFSITKKGKQQAVSALWVTLPYDEGEVEANHIIQYYGKGVIAGLMPIGKNPLEGESKNIVNLFWGVNGKENPLKSEEDFKLFKEQLYRFLPDNHSIVDKITTKEQLTFAPYFDNQVGSFYEGNVAFIGDASHAMSPQLSSGTNLALLDAYELAKVLNEGDLKEGLKRFSKMRKKQVDYYLCVSRIVTPVFQNPVEYKFIRDKIPQLCYKIPPIKKILLETLMGLKAGWFKNLPKDYY